MAGYWLKLYTEILEDPKYHRLSDNAKLGMYELFLLAKKNIADDGFLPDIEDIAFYTRRNPDWWIPVIDELAKCGIVIKEDDRLCVRNFSKRQAPIDARERAKQSRMIRNKNAYVSHALAYVSHGETETDIDTEAETEKDADADADADLSGGGELPAAFAELYPGLKPRDSADQTSWTDAYSQMIRAGVTPAIMRRAARELADKAMRVAAPGSLVKPCLMVMQRDPPRKRDSTGSFAEFVNR